MKKITITAYTFEELSKDVQERLIREYRQSNDYGDDLEDYLNERLKELTGLKFDLTYSLCHMQGDGVRFIGQIAGDEINKLPFAPLVKDASRTIISILPTYIFHAPYQVDIDIDVEAYTDDELEKLKEAVNEWYGTIADALKEAGYEYIEDMESDEYIRDFLIANEYLYMADGRMI